VIRYGLAVDRRDWAMFERCFTDPVNTGYNSEGVPSDVTARKDPDCAVCISSTYAQHLLKGSPNGEFYLSQAIYAD